MTSGCLDYTWRIYLRTIAADRLTTSRRPLLQGSTTAASRARVLSLFAALAPPIMPRPATSLPAGTNADDTVGPTSTMDDRRTARRRTVAGRVQPTVRLRARGRVMLSVHSSCIEFRCRGSPPAARGNQLESDTLNSAQKLTDSDGTAVSKLVSDQRSEDFHSNYVGIYLVISSFPVAVAMR